MIKTTISRMDNIYECFPDVARTPDGVLVCIYRESMGHGPFPFSRLVVRRSVDEGKNWMDRQILMEAVHQSETIDKHRDWLEDDAIAGYEQSRSRIKEDWQAKAGINCSRIICLADGTLFLIADLAIYDQPTRWENRIWRSKDSGVTWEGGEVADLAEGIVPSVTQLKNGDILVGLVTSPDIFAFVCRSSDGGHTWSEPIYMPRNEDYLAAEVSYVELDDGTIVGFARNYAREKKHLPGLGCKVISRDGGKTWNGPFDTWLMGCEGRPKAGLLASGEVCITYRCGMPNELLAMHVMTQAAAGSDKMAQLIERQPSMEDIPAWQAKEKGEDRPEYMTSYYPGRTIILDWDRSVHRDSGYSGWVQLDNGDIFVVDYINDDAPLAHIRGYRVNRSDIILFPEGDLPWLHPSGQPFRAITHAMAKKQMQTNSQRRQKE